MTTPTVPGYDELEKIGSGGFAAVYRATQTAVGREVALKLLHHAIADEDTERRFQRECRVVGSLSWHPHIAAVLDAGADAEGRSYLAFELLTGGSLGDRLKDSGPIPWTEAVMFAIQTADALAAAHGEEVLHRDVKPDNILIDRLGRAKLADFGIAQMHDGNQTKSGVITATLAHAAPEVLNGKRATELSDVYLLGSTIFELIVGEPPFGKTLGNDFFGAIQRIATEPAPRLVEIEGVNVPAELSALVDRSLQKEPEARFESAAAFGLALRAMQREAGLAVTSMPFVEAEPGQLNGEEVAPVPQAAEQPAPATPTPQTEVVVEESSPAGLLLVDEPAVFADESSSAGLPVIDESPSAALPLVDPSPAVASEPSPRGLPIVNEPLRAGDATSVVAPTSAAGSGGVAVPAQPIDSFRSPADASPTASKSRMPILVGALVVIGLAVGGFFLFTGGSTSQTPGGIAAIEVNQTDSQLGQNGSNVIDADLATGWLSPTNPDGHQIVIGFGESVMLSAIDVHSGPDPSGAGVLAESRGLGPAVLGFSDGTEMTVDFDESISVETIAIDKRTSSLSIRTLSQGGQPVAIREVEFTGEAQP